MNRSNGIANLERVIANHKQNEIEVKILIGKDRYQHLNDTIRGVLETAGLTEMQSQHLLSHLSDTFRLERIHV
ncbi:hypothetical protein FB479_101546 [Brevibacillus sp. AG162]|nr:hypothetical protein FB479_101546 [Brevibacillus sp. AG162]